jgi:hypothetical protein
MSDDNLFCSNLFNRYFECIRINVAVFGKERGNVMCDHIKTFIDNSICDKKEDKTLYFIDKIAEKVEKKN